MTKIISGQELKTRLLSSHPDYDALAEILCDPDFEIPEDEISGVKSRRVVYLDSITTNWPVIWRWMAIRAAVWLGFFVLCAFAVFGFAMVAALFS